MKEYTNPKHLPPTEFEKIVTDISKILNDKDEYLTDYDYVYIALGILETTAKNIKRVRSPLVKKQSLKYLRELVNSELERITK